MKHLRQSTIRHNIELRAKVIHAIRNYFVSNDFLEVETPVRIPSPAPEAHIDGLASENWFLHTSPELCMKQLLAAGYPRIFQICRCFRKNERGQKHIPEFTLLEWYCEHVTYHDLMNQCEELIRYVKIGAGYSDSIFFKKKHIHIDAPFDRLTVREAFERFSSVSLEDALLHDRFDEIIDSSIEPKLGWERPVFLIDYPVSQGAFARLKPGGDKIVERFELYIAGIEICNACTEITDPDEQRNRFEKENRLRRFLKKPEYPLPEKFLEAMDHMPQAAGNALGIDRIVMVLTDSSSIDDVVLFTPEDMYPNGEKIVT